MHSHLVEQEFELNLQVTQIKTPSLAARVLMLLVECGAPGEIIRGVAAHPFGVAVASLWRCLALARSARTGVRTNTPDEPYKKPPAIG